MAFTDQRPQEGAPATRTASDIEVELAAIDSASLQASNASIAAAAVDSPAEADEAAIASAGAKGWVPKNLYKGEASKWVDAKTFLERGERFTVNLQREVSELRTKLESFEGTKAAFTKFHEETVAKKEEEIKDTISALRVQRSKATREGEDELAVELEDQIELLRGQQKELQAPVTTEKDKQAPPDASVPNPVMDEWIDDGNQWFKTDSQLRDYAIAIGDALYNNGETLRGRKFLDKVREQVESDFPRKFRALAAVQGGGASLVEGAGGGGGGSGGSKTERDLPQEDRDLMRQFIKEGWTTKEKFLASYFSTNS